MKRKLLNLNTFIAKEIQYMLEKEGYREGDRLPSDRKLADHFGVERHTVRTALFFLERRGIIMTKEKSGHYMVKPRIPVFLDQFLDPEILLAADKAPFEKRVINFGKTQVSRNLVYKMHIPEGTEIFHVCLLWSSSVGPVCLERSFIPCIFAPSLGETDLRTCSRYQKLAVAHMDQKMEVVNAETGEAELLRVSLARPLMKFSGFTFNGNNECIEYFERIIVSDSYIFYC